MLSHDVDDVDDDEDEEEDEEDDDFVVGELGTPSASRNACLPLDLRLSLRFRIRTAHCIALFHSSFSSLL